MKFRRTTHPRARKLAALGGAAALALGAAACETDDTTGDDPIDDEIREDTGDADMDEGEPGVDDDADAPDDDMDDMDDADD